MSEPSPKGLTRLYLLRGRSNTLSERCLAFGFFLFLLTRSPLARFRYALIGTARNYAGFNVQIDPLARRHTLARFSITALRPRSFPTLSSCCTILHTQGFGFGHLICQSPIYSSQATSVASHDHSHPILRHP